MQITQGNWQAQINTERGSLGLTRTEAVDMMLLAAGHTYKEIARPRAAHPKPCAAVSKGLSQAGRL
ncbi:hypothetical protein HORIV_34840 [Vreelandella olivaria]|uniref:Uncharacterized protein n=1 Tax=Vreelandella olivaria TaxID=390919 RepID=A0ABM7GK98_9GAMM|nr:hypothetical protein HORIV_34840 [Halomonas olivaria]